MFVGQDVGEGKVGICSSRLQALATLGSGLGLLGSWPVEPGPLGFLGRPSPLNCASLSSLQPTSPSVCTSWVPTPLALVPTIFTRQGFLGWARKQPDPDLQAGFPALHGRPRDCGSLLFLAW